MVAFRMVSAGWYVYDVAFRMVCVGWYRLQCTMVSKGRLRMVSFRMVQCRDGKCRDGTV